MKTQRPARQPRATKPAEPAKPTCEQALRLCEEAAARVKSASDELAACWRTLGHELSNGVSATELLRRRAWCNVLELRLKERAQALEEARLCIDAVWNEMLHAARDRGLDSAKDGQNLFGRSWSLLLQSRPATTLRNRTTTVKH